jgi:hypothetical protein
MTLLNMISPNFLPTLSKRSTRFGGDQTEGSSWFRAFGASRSPLELPLDNMDLLGPICLSFSCEIKHLKRVLHYDYYQA